MAEHKLKKLMNQNKNSRKKVGIIFKSGNIFIFTCDKMTWNVNGDGNISSYKIINSSPSINYVNPLEITAVITYSIDEN